MVSVVHSEDGESFACYVGVTDASSFDDGPDVIALKKTCFVQFTLAVRFLQMYKVNRN